MEKVKRKKTAAVRTIATALLIGFGISSGHAATAVCSGPVLEVGNHAPGGLYVRLADAGGIMKICDFNVTWFRTTPADCKQHLATAQLALATGKTVSVYVDNAPTTACSSIVNWNGYDVRYFGILK
jgi:hypothetical protein